MKNKMCPHCKIKPVDITYNGYERKTCFDCIYKYERYLIKLKKQI